MVISWWWVIISSGHHGVSARRWWAIGISISWHGGYNVEETREKIASYLLAILQTIHLIDCREATTKEWSVHLRPALFRVAKKLFFYYTYVYPSGLTWQIFSVEDLLHYEPVVPSSSEGVLWMTFLWKRNLHSQNYHSNLQSEKMKNIWKTNFNQTASTFSDRRWDFAPLDGGPLIGPPLDPRGPLGAPRLRECIIGGPRLPPLSNIGFVACSTLIVFPSRDCNYESKEDTVPIAMILQEFWKRGHTYLAIHFTCSILCITRALKSYKRKASRFVCFTVLHQNNWNKYNVKQDCVN